jgi:uncharacterized protein (TIGR02246 family)
MMKRSVLIALGFTALVGCSHTFGPADAAAIRQVISDQQIAWNKGDLKGYMEGYVKSDKLVFTSGGRVRRGWKVTYEKYKKSYQDAGAMGKVTFSNLHIEPLGSDAAVVLGRWEVSGSSKASKGVFTVVFVRRSEGWRVIHDHTSVIAGPAAKPK